MVLCDVNVLVYAHRVESVRHDEYRAWLESAVNDEPVFGVSDLVLSSFIRVVTNPRVFGRPTPTGTAVDVANDLRAASRAIVVAPGPRHWRIFTRLCVDAAAKGKLVPDAYFAALAIESGSEWITTDRDYARFPGLRWRDPLAA